MQENPNTSKTSAELAKNYVLYVLHSSGIYLSFHLW